VAETVNDEKEEIAAGTGWEKVNADFKL